MSFGVALPLVQAWLLAVLFSKPIPTFLFGTTCGARCKKCPLPWKGPSPAALLKHRRANLLMPDEALAMYRVMRDQYGSRLVGVNGTDPLSTTDQRRGHDILLEETRNDGNYFYAISSGVGGIEPEVAKLYQSNPRAFLYLSVDDVGAFHDTIRDREGLFDEIETTINNFDEAGIKDQLVIATYADPDGYDRLDRILDWIVELGLKYWAISPELIDQVQLQLMPPHLIIRDLEGFAAKFLAIRDEAAARGVTVFTTTDFQKMLQRHMSVPEYAKNFFGGPGWLLRAGPTRRVELGIEVLETPFHTRVWKPGNDHYASALTFLDEHVPRAA